MSYSFNHKTNHMHGSNISVVIQFKCDRCGRCHYEDPDEQEDAEHNIQCYKPPYGWEFKRGGYLLCSKCSTEYDEIMDEFFGGDKQATYKGIPCSKETLESLTVLDARIDRYFDDLGLKGI